MAKAPSKQDDWDIPTVLQRLDDHLNQSPRSEAARLSSIMYDRVSELAAVHQILSGSALATALVCEILRFGFYGRRPA